MINCVVHGCILSTGVYDRSKQNKPNLSYADIYIKADGGTHRIFNVPDSFSNSYSFGDEVTLYVNISGNFISYVSEVK